MVYFNRRHDYEKLMTAKDNYIMYLLLLQVSLVLECIVTLVLAFIKN